MQEKLSLVSLVQRYLVTDDTDDSERIIRTYEAATPDQKAVIDDIFTSLCGWRLCTIIEEAKHGKQ